MHLLSRKNIVVVILLALIGVAILNEKLKVFAITFCTDENSPADLSIVTFNIDAIKGDAGADFAKRIVDVFSDTQADVLCLQEVSEENIKHLYPILDSICGYRSDSALCAFQVRYRLFSRKPIRNYKRYKAEGICDTIGFTHDEVMEIVYMQNEMHAYSAEIEVKPNEWVTVFSGHLRSSAYSTARRSMDEDSNWWDGLSLYWRNYKIGKRIRDYEAENVRRFIDEARAEGCPVIVAGDLNDWCGSDCLETLMGSNLKDAWWEGGNGFGWTYFGWNLRLRLDHILYSDELELVDVGVIDTDISDHKPLMARFRVK